jgi:ABC-type amino acid transport substrate-binding protein
MQKIGCALFIFFFFAYTGSPVRAEDNDRKQLVCGIAIGYPPYQFKDEQGQPTGIDADVARLVFEELNRPIRFVQKKWDDVYLSMAHKVEGIDLLCGTEVNDRRKALFDFSEPYYNRAVVIFVRSESDYRKAQDLEGKLIAGDRDGKIEQIIETRTLRVMTTISKEDSFRKLKKGDVEAVLAPLEVGNWLCRRMGLSVRILPERDPGSPVAFAVAKGDTALARQISGALEKIKQDGRLEAIMAKYR